MPSSPRCSAARRWRAAAAAIAGTMAAVILLGVISNVLNLLEVSAFVQTFAKGLIVVVAILATRARAGRARLGETPARHRRASRDAG